MRMQRSLNILGVVLAAVALQGCVGTATVLSNADHQSLQSLPLFAPDGTPRFSLELACSGAFVSCNTIRHAFEHWADDRHIHLQMAGVEYAPRADRQATMPYRLAVGITPLVISTIDNITFKYDDYAHHATPKVGYRASLQVFGSGRQLRHMALHDERIADYKADANIALRDEMKTLIASVDPAYRSR